MNEQTPARQEAGVTGQAVVAKPNSFHASGHVPSEASRLTGPRAAVWKYDLLTALSIYALGQGATMQTTVLRLIAAITARYDWRRDELSIGRAELVRLWQCSEPTVKREVRRLRESGLLVVLRPGVRGRVAAYRLCRHTIATLTSEHWACAGADFAARMAGPEAIPPETSPDTNVVSFPKHEGRGDVPDLPLWAQVIADEDAVIYRNWFVRVSARAEGDTVVFHAPSEFIARQIETRFLRQVQDAARYQWPGLNHIRVVV